MKTFLFPALLAAGVVLLVLGFQAKDSVGSQMSEMFNGSPSDTAMWYLIGGAALVAVGIAGIVKKRKSP